MKEICSRCKFCTKLYVPPCKYLDNIPKDAYVCTVWLLTGEDNSVQYLENDQSFCEMFTKKGNV